MGRCAHSSANGASRGHVHGRTLCFDCFRSGMEHTRARREAWAQRGLPFEAAESPQQPMTEQAVAHRRRMLEYLATTDRRRA